MNLPDQFGETSTDQPQYQAQHSYPGAASTAGRGSHKPSRGRRRSYPRKRSVPNWAPTGCETPASTRSFCSNDTGLDGVSSVWSYRPPSSIHLQDSIENYLDISLETPDDLDASPPGCSRNRWREKGRRKPYLSSSTSDLQSLQEYHDSLEQQARRPHHASHDSMTFSTASELSLDAGYFRSPRRLPRSNSDSVTSPGGGGGGAGGSGAGMPRDLSFPSGYESAESERTSGREDWKHVFDSKRKVQNLLDDIHDLCTETSD